MKNFEAAIILCIYHFGLKFSLALRPFMTRARTTHLSFFKDNLFLMKLKMSLYLCKRNPNMNSVEQLY